MKGSSSFVEEGQRKAGYVIVSLHSTTEAQALPNNSSTQLAELTALPRTVELARDKRITIYTDSKRAFLVLHAYTTIWVKRESLTSKNTPIKYATHITHMLEAIHQPKEVAVGHCRGPQKGDSEIIQGNETAGQAANQAAFPTGGPHTQPSTTATAQIYRKGQGLHKQKEFFPR